MQQSDDKHQTSHKRALLNAAFVILAFFAVFSALLYNSPKIIQTKMTKFVPWESEWKGQRNAFTSAINVKGAHDLIANRVSTKTRPSGILDQPEHFTDFNWDGPNGRNVYECIFQCLLFETRDLLDGKPIPRSVEHMPSAISMKNLCYIAKPKNDNFEELVLFFHGAGTPALNTLQAFARCQNKQGYAPFFGIDPNSRELKCPAYVFPEYEGYGDLYSSIESYANESAGTHFSKRYMKQAFVHLRNFMFAQQPYNKLVVCGYSIGTKVVMEAFSDIMRLEAMSVGKKLATNDITIKLAGIVDLHMVDKAIRVPHASFDSSFQGFGIVDCFKNMNDWAGKKNIRINVHIYYSEHDEMNNGFKEQIPLLHDPPSVGITSEKAHSVACMKQKILQAEIFENVDFSFFDVNRESNSSKVIRGQEMTTTYPHKMHVSSEKKRKLKYDHDSIDEVFFNM